MRLRCASLMLAALWAQPAQAAIIGSCTIVVGPSGVMTTSPSIQILGSAQAGGSRAHATVTASSLLCSLFNLIDCYTISAPAPAAFTSAPSGGDSGVSFATSFRLNGGGENPGNVPVRVANGAYATDIHLTATRASGVFPTGTYQAQVTVRCE